MASVFGAAPCRERSSRVVTLPPIIGMMRNGSLGRTLRSHSTNGCGGRSVWARLPSILPRWPASRIGWYLHIGMHRRFRTEHRSPYW